MERKQIECAGFTFLADFDSANLARVEFVPKKPPAPPEKGKQGKKKTTNTSNNNQNRVVQKKSKPVEVPDYEFNIWTRPDCAGTEFENSNRTWFYFGVTGGKPFNLIKLNIIDLNKQSKMYSQGMAPVFKIVPGKCQWERVRDKPVFTSENNIFTISFKFRTSENIRAVTYFAFTYPFSYTELQNYLGCIDSRMARQENLLPKPEIRFNKGLKIVNDINDAIYYHREVICHSLQNRNIDLITLSSHHNITSEREPRLKNLFPNENIQRPYKFHEKKVIFISSRVHPGETPSSFVMNGIINLLIQKDDPVAILLRRQFVFKLIPMLNPDGVALGHYRTDTRGCNLNRYYLNPSLELHPSVYGARSLIRYHHFGEELEDDIKQEKFDVSSQVDPNELSESDFSCPDIESPKQSTFYSIDDKPSESELKAKASQISEIIERTEKALVSVNLLENPPIEATTESSTDVSNKSVSNKPSKDSLSNTVSTVINSDDESSFIKDFLLTKDETNYKVDNESLDGSSQSKKSLPKSPLPQNSGIFLYLDMHGHASKKGVFIYGNHFEKPEDKVECMLFPKIMSVNSQNFHFPACNFTEKNMYLRDKRDGTSREGSGRVAVLRITGLIRSYTLECNYNTGRFVNKLPQCCRDLPGKANTNLIVPPKYCPSVYEEIGRSICISLLDLTNSNPWSRIPNSEYHTLCGVRDWLKLKIISESFLYHKTVPRSHLRTKFPNKSSQTQVMMGVLKPDVRPAKLLSNVLLASLHSKQSVPTESNADDNERKENISFRGTPCNTILMNRKEAGPSHTKRAMSRAVLQVRGGSSRPIKSLKKTIYRAGDRLQKFKQYNQKSENNLEEPTVDSGENDRRPKVASSSDQYIFKQNPKRLKISKGDEVSKIKVLDWTKEDEMAGPSCSDIVMYRLNLASGEGVKNKRIVSKPKQPLVPLKFKKSLEKRRGSDASRKKSKTLFKKAGKIILTNEVNKNSMDRKRRKN